jgi:hypothetical protein
MPIKGHGHRAKDSIGEGRRKALPGCRAEGPKLGKPLAVRAARAIIGI